MEVPRLEKIVVNMGVGEAVGQPSLLDGAVRRPHDHHRPEAGDHPGQEVDRRLQAPRGQRHRRQGHPAGRPHVGVPRPADQPGDPPHPRLPRPRPPNSFDGRGNYTFGVTEQLIFPEIDYDKVDTTRGMDITIVTTARTNAEGKALLDAFGFPFKREGQQ